MFKKYTSAIMALVMIMALALPGVYAVSSGSYSVSSGTTGVGNTFVTALECNALGDKKDSQEVKPVVALAVPELKITFQGSGAIILNPYKLNVTIAANAVNAAASGGSDVTGNDPVVGVPILIQSKTSSPVKVGVKAKATKSSGGNFNLAATAPAATETKKILQLWLEAGETANGKNDSTGANPKWATTYSTSAKNVAIFAENPGNDYKYIYILEPSNGTTPTVGYFKAAGAMTLKPTEAWGTKDTVSASITFHFKPANEGDSL